jgi:condensin complex subunit 2
METMTENADPNLTLASGDQDMNSAKANGLGGVYGGTKPPLSKKRVSISPKKTTILSPGGSRARNGRRLSSSHFVAAASEQAKGEDDDSDIEFNLDGPVGIGGGEKLMTTIDVALPVAAAANKTKNKSQQRRRRRSSSRFLQLSSGSALGDDGDETGADGDTTRSPRAEEDVNDFTSSEHLGEIYRQAIRMNAENKINAGNSWGFKLIENMDKFIVEDGNNGVGGDGINSPRDNDGRDDLMAARQMKSRDDKGRVNFAKASCTLDASVKIYSYRVDDVHLSSFRVLANLNRSDNKKDADACADDNGGKEEVGEKAVKRKTGPKGPTETLETNLGKLLLNHQLKLHYTGYGISFDKRTQHHCNLQFTRIPANINMSKLDSAYDIDPLFHKMSKSFDEGGAKGLLLGNLGVSENGCHIVFDSKEDRATHSASAKLDKITETEEADEFNIDPDEAVVWNEKDIDITNLAAKLESMLASYGHKTSSSVPFVPQLESLRCDYAELEEEGFVVDEKDALREGRKGLRLYDAP